MRDEDVSRVVIEYKDGERRTWEGSDAGWWSSTMTCALSLAYVHGMTSKVPPPTRVEHMHASVAGLEKKP